MGDTMSKVLILAHCDQCRFHKDKCILSNKKFPELINGFPEWCELRNTKEFYFMMKEKEEHGEDLYF